MINLLSNWVWENLLKRPLNKIIGLFFIIITFIVVILIVYTIYPPSALPSGLDKENTASIIASWNNKGLALYEQGNYTGAIICYDMAIQIDPGYLLAWSNKGNALKALNRNSEAQKAFSIARGEP